MAHLQRRSRCSSHSDRDAPVLFLDIDGVLNVNVDATATAAGAFSPLHTSLLNRLARVLRRSHARVVLSSSWRHDRQRLALLERAWRRAQLPPLDTETPTLATAVAVATFAHTGSIAARQRVLEIEQWLRDDAVRCGRSICRWAAVDDLDLAAAAELTTRPNYVQTDPQCGLSVDNMETLVSILTGDAEETNTSLTLSLSLSAESQWLQLVVDLIVVVNSATPVTPIVIDCADFSIVACLDTTQQPLREWLRAQETEFSLDRIATIDLRHEDEEAATVETSGIHVRIPSADMSPEVFASAFVRDVTTTDSLHTANSSRVPTVMLLLDAIQERELASREGIESATRQLRDVGFSADAAAELATNTKLIWSLLDVLPVLEPLLPRRIRLAVETCGLFPQPSDCKARHLLSEYIARGEITSRATLEAVKLMWTAQDHVLEELDEMLSVL